MNRRAALTLAIALTTFAIILGLSATTSTPNGLTFLALIPLYLAARIAFRVAAAIELERDAQRLAALAEGVTR